MPTAFDSSTLSGLGSMLPSASSMVLPAALVMARPIGILLILPVFTRVQTGGLLRSGIAFSLSLPLLAYAPDAAIRIENSPNLPVVWLTITAFKELFVGFMIGFMFSVPFWCIQAVGELIDTQRGINNEVAPVDPSTRSQASALGLFLSVIAIAIFVATGGLNTLVDTLYSSYAVWPVRNPMPRHDLDTMMVFARMLDRVLASAINVGGPVIALLLLLDLCVMLIGRFAAQLNVYDLAPTIKNVAVVLFLTIYVNYLFDYTGAELGTTTSVVKELSTFLR